MLCLSPAHTRLIGIDKLRVVAHAQVALTEETAGEYSNSVRSQGKRGRGVKGEKIKKSGSTGLSPSQHNYARVSAVASSQVSASRSLNGAGYRAAFTDPQHQLQPLRFGKNRFSLKPPLLLLRPPPN